MNLSPFYFSLHFNSLPPSLNSGMWALALALNVPASRIHEIVKERRSITSDTG
jgi:plasmid maintenance system antidote protein VapI